MRPPKKICPDQLYELAKLQCTWKEMAAVFQCCEETLRKNPLYTVIKKEGEEAGKTSLRRMQFKLAQKSSAMAIWLGKQYLRQKEPDPEMKEYAKNAFEKYFEENRREYEKKIKEELKQKAKEKEQKSGAK